jgi:hypothetical protein
MCARLIWFEYTRWQKIGLVVEIVVVICLGLKKKFFFVK